MHVTNKTNYAIVSTTIHDINNKEMRQMHEMKERIKDVLESHKNENKKNEYLTDEELAMIHAILSVFTEDFSSTQTSAFDDFLKEQAEPQPVDAEEDCQMVAVI